MINLPKDFTERMKKQLGDEYDKFLASYDAPPVRGLRVNTLRISKEDFLRIAPEGWQLTKTQLSPEGFIIGSSEGEEQAGRHPYHAAGAYYIQEPSAMSVAAELAAYPFDDNTKVLDMCAAPGGKTGAVAAYMRGRGILIANEIVRKRAQELAGNTERLGITNCIVTNSSPDRVAEAFPGYFDIVITDAPCSGEGMFRKNPDSCTEWSPSAVASCAVRQRLILKSAAQCVAYGGILIYSTCTFSPEENEETVEAFTKECGFRVVRMQRLYPHTCDGEGHFLCVMRKDGDNICDNAPDSRHSEKKTVKSSQPAFVPCKAKVFTDFMDDTYDKKPQACAYTDRGGRVILADDRMIRAAQKLPCISCGVEAGYDKGSYFAPSHTLFMAAYDCIYRLSYDIPPESDEMKSFMAGEETDSPFDAREGGMCRICTDGMPLGFCKVSSGKLKNKLPKGLRRMQS